MDSVKAAVVGFISGIILVCGIAALVLIPKGLASISSIEILLPDVPKELPVIVGIKGDGEKVFLDTQYILKTEAKPAVIKINRLQ